MNRRELLLDFVLSDGNGGEWRFREFLTEINVVMLTRVRDASHGPASELLRSLVAQVGCLGHVQVRGFEIRSSDVPCATCRGPHVIYGGHVVMTICDGGGIIRQLLGITDDDQILIVGPDRRVVDKGRIKEVERLSRRLSLEAEPAVDQIARAPPKPQHTGRRGEDS